MSETDRYEKIVRWYPAKWRARYGQGLAALLEDTYGAKAVPLRIRAALARAGVAERAREAGVVGSSTSSNERLRVGSQLVLCGWSLFLVAGAIFAKFSEHWNVTMPTAHRTLPTIGDNAVQWAGGVGALAVLVAGAFVVPAALRLVRTEGWLSIRRPVLRVVLAIGASAVLTAGLAVWAHHLNYHQRNGGMVPYEIVFLLTCAAIVATIAIGTSTVITVTRQLNFSRQTLRILSSTALGLTLLMTVTACGTAVWWASEATYAPQFLSNSIGSGLLLTSNSLPPTLLVAGALMLFGISTAVMGSLRVLGGFKTA